MSILCQVSLSLQREKILFFQNEQDELHNYDTEGAVSNRAKLFKYLNI